MGRSLGAGARPMATKRKQPITCFFPPLPKRRDQEERAVSAEGNTHGSMDQETVLPRSGVTIPEELSEDERSDVDIADFVAASSLSVPDQVKYRVIKERKPSLSVSIPSKTYNDSKRKGGTYRRHCNREYFLKFSTCWLILGPHRVSFTWHVFSSPLVVHMKGRLGPNT